MPEPEISTITAVKGTQQSPIDLRIQNSIHASLGPVKLNYPDPIVGKFVIADEETHTHAQFTVENGSDSNLVFAGHSAKLVAIHFHSPSEHWIDGQHFSTEFHFVHDIVAYPKASTAEPSLKLVIGFFAEADEQIKPCETENTVNPRAFTTRLKNFLAAQQPGVRVEDECAAVDIPDNLPEQIETACKEIFFYRGSLTSFAYDETVSWIVPIAPIKTEAAFLNEIKQTKQPTRSLQLINRRLLLLSKS